MKDIPNLGVGLMLKETSMSSYLKNQEKIDEICDIYEILVSKYFLGQNSSLDEIKGKITKPLLLHATWSSLGTDEEIEKKNLEELRNKLNSLVPLWWSDHLCFNGVKGIQTGTLLPPILTSHSKEIFIKKIKFLKKEFKIPFLIENVPFLFNPIGEIDYFSFITDIISETNSGIVLGIDNLVESKKFYNIDPFNFIDNLPLENIIQIHCPLEENKSTQYDEILEYISTKKEIKPRALIWQPKDEVLLDFNDEVVDKLKWSKNIFFEERESIGYNH